MITSRSWLAWLLLSVGTVVDFGLLFESWVLGLTCGGIAGPVIFFAGPGRDLWMNSPVRPSVKARSWSELT